MFVKNHQPLLDFIQTYKHPPQNVSIRGQKSRTQIVKQHCKPHAELGDLYFITILIFNILIVYNRTIGAETDVDSSIPSRDME